MCRLYANTMPFCIRSLNTHGFWYSWGSWNQSPMDTEGCLSMQRISLERYTREEKTQWLRHREVGNFLLYTFWSFDPCDYITYLKVKLINHHLQNTYISYAIIHIWSLGFKVRCFSMFSLPSLRKTDHEAVFHLDFPLQIRSLRGFSLIAKLSGREIRACGVLILEKRTFVFWVIHSVFPGEGKRVTAGFSGSYYKVLAREVQPDPKSSL